MSLDLAAHFSRTIAADPERVHFAAHSHHFLPDVTREAQLRCWDDAARLADRKWETVFGEVMPRVRQGIAARLGLPDAGSIAMAPNTHSLILRLLTCFPREKPVRILTSDGEFHSFTRQIARLEEERLVEVQRIPCLPSATFAKRFLDAATAFRGDLVFVSHVFFDSAAMAPSPQDIARAVRDPATFIVIDGYHAFMAMPVDLASVAGRIFYMAGGYKYAMSGEGACFIHCPPGYGPRPRDTGWFAAFGALSRRDGGVAYAQDGGRFLGATFDVSGIYRMRAVFDWMDGLGLTVDAIHGHVIALLDRLVATLDASGIAGLSRDNLVTPVAAGARRGHFLAFTHPASEENERRLLAANIIVDRRGDRLRFGLGCYHRTEDVEAGAARVVAALR